MDFVSTLAEVAERFSFSHWGFTPIQAPLSMVFYREWLAAGFHAQMDYLERHADMKENPRLLAPKANSAIMVAKNYLPHPYPSSSTLAARTALYACGEDYHLAFRKELEQMAELLKVKFPSEEFLCFTDSAPVLERDLAVQAGLGWVGKNTCLIHPQKGSLFFIGEILTSLTLDQRTPLPDFCGTCDRCIRACPTGAFAAPRVLDANKCIAYWTIESKEVAPVGLRDQFGDWFFGCDICQTVCPWNEKVFGKEPMRALTKPPPNKNLVPELRKILGESNKNLSRAFADHPYSRARPLGLKRNALYVIGNLGLRELANDVRPYLQHEKLKDLADWALKRLE